MTVAEEEQLRRLIAAATEQRAYAAVHPQAWWLR